MYTVSGLQVNTTYSFAVSVTNNATKAKVMRGDILSATTFANLTADFDGIASVRSPAGSAGAILSSLNGWERRRWRCHQSQKW